MLVKFEGVEMDVHESKAHEWLLETSLVAKGYGVPSDHIKKALKRRTEDLIEGKHYVTGIGEQLSPNSKKRGRPNEIYWTKKGVVRLGFILRCEKAKLFRDWAEDLIIERQNHTKVILDKFSEFSETLLAENEALKRKLDHYEKQLVQSGFSQSPMFDSDEYNPLNISKYKTVKEWLKENNLELDIDSVIRISNLAKQVSSEDGFHVMFKPNQKFGKVNFYHGVTLRSAFYQITGEFLEI